VCRRMGEVMRIHPSIYNDHYFHALQMNQRPGTFESNAYILVLIGAGSTPSRHSIIIRVRQYPAVV
jgi:hypothetical protein